MYPGIPIIKPLILHIIAVCVSTFFFGKLQQSLCTGADCFKGFLLYQTENVQQLVLKRWNSIWKSHAEACVPLDWLWSKLSKSELKLLSQALKVSSLVTAHLQIKRPNLVNFKRAPSKFSCKVSFFKKLRRN